VREDAGVEARSDREQREWLLAEESRVARRIVAELKAELESAYGRLDDTLDEVVRLRSRDPAAAGSTRHVLQTLARRPALHRTVAAAEEPPSPRSQA
jgi:hypothetical protein